MAQFDPESGPDAVPDSDAARIGQLLGLAGPAVLDDVGLAHRVALGFQPAAADALSAVIGRAEVVGPLIPEATLRRARAARKPLSRAMSERLYEMGRMVEMVGRTYGGDRTASNRFLNRPHPLLDGMTPLAMAQSSSAGAAAVMNLLHRAAAGVAL